MRRRAQELRDEVEAKTADVNAGRISRLEFKAFVDRADRQSAEIRDELKAFDDAAKWSFGTEANLGLSDLPVPDYGRIVAPSPMDMTPQQLQGLMAAAQSRTPYQVEIKPKSFREAVQTKAAVTEAGIGGSFTGQLPPVQSPNERYFDPLGGHRLAAGQLSRLWTCVPAAPTRTPTWC